jgi:hypothetical protein
MFYNSKCVYCDVNKIFQEKDELSESGLENALADRKDSEQSADTQLSPNVTPKENEEDPGGSPKSAERLETIVEENEVEAQMSELDEQ